MKFSILSITLPLAVVSAHGRFSRTQNISVSEWHPPGPNDVRGPCPMLNTLANHGFLPRDGRNITKDNAVFAMNIGLGFEKEFAAKIWGAGVTVNPEPNATFFTLEQLSVHNLLEHDASLSRADAFFGSNILFNATVFAQTTSYWTAETLTMDMLANAKLARQIESRATNPTYTFTEGAEGFSRGEVTSFALMFGDREAGTVNRTLTEFFFENEKLPTEIGWVKPDTEITNQMTKDTESRLAKALTLLTGVEDTAVKSDMHLAIGY